MLAYADAAAHYEAALDAPSGRGRERGGVLLALGARARPRRLRGPRRAPRSATSAELARDARDPVLLARAALGHGGVGVLVAGARRRVTRPLEEALAALPSTSAALAARLRARLAVELYYPDRAGAEELSAQAVEDARASGDPAALAAALNARRVALWTPRADRRAPGRRDRDDRGRRGGRRPRGRPAGAQLARRGPDGARAPARAGRRDRRLRGARGRASGSRTTAGTSRCGARRSRSSRAAGRTARAARATRRSRSPRRPTTRWRRGWCARSARARSRSAG